MKEKRKTYNHKYAQLIIQQLENEPTQTKEICAKDYNLPYEQFGILLDALVSNGFLCPFSKNYEIL